jgi:hypothetical protein
MAAGPNDNTHFTAQDIERYYAGQMSAQERHALEKAALDDPFLADALEGYKFTQTPTADVAALKELLAQKNEQDKVVPLAAPHKRSYPLLRIAALFVLLLGVGWSVYYLMDSKRDKLALDTKESSKPVTTTAPVREAETDTTATIQAAPESEITFAQPAPPTATASAPLKKQAEKKAVDQQAAEPIAAPPTASASAPVSDAPTLLRADSNREDAAVQRQQAINVAGIQARAANVSNAFNGRVVDANNQGIPSASVSIKNSRTGTTTDPQGYFSLNTPDTSVKATVNAVGFESKDITLNNRSQENNIVLKEGNQSLEEVVVTGVSAKRKRSVAPTTAATTLSEPLEGWEHFNTYISRNRKSAKELGAQETTGTVTLTFTINRQGKPANIKVETSLSPQHDAEAIRLLQKGPKWDRKKSTRGKLTISFP